MSKKINFRDENRILNNGMTLKMSLTILDNFDNKYRLIQIISKLSWKLQRQFKTLTAVESRKMAEMMVMAEVRDIKKTFGIGA